MGNLNGAVVQHHRAAPPPPASQPNGVAAVWSSIPPHLRPDSNVPVGDALLALTPLGEITWASPAAGLVLGQPADRLLRRRLGELVHPDDRPAVVRLLAAAASAAPGPGASPIAVRREEAPAPGLHVACCPVMALAGAPHVLCALRPEPNGGAPEPSADGPNETKGAGSDIVSFVSHEFRTPLTSIIGYAELLALGGHPEPDAVAFADAILREAKRLNSLVDDLLLLDRASGGRLRINRAEVDLRRLVIEDVDRARRSWPGRVITCDVAPDLPPVTTDPSRLSQVVANLLSNALKYSPDGGPVSVAAYRVGDRVSLSVSDAGIGIPAAALERIFHRFQRVLSPRTSAIEGNGLGLAIVREIVTLLGGRVWADSIEGVGSTFTVELPIT